MTEGDAQHTPPTLLECLKIAERLRPDEIPERIAGRRHGHIVEGFINELQEKAGVGTAFMQLSAGMEKPWTISQRRSQIRVVSQDFSQRF